MVRLSRRIDAPKWKLTEACSRQPGPSACSLREYVFLHLELAKTWKMKGRLRGSRYTSIMIRDAQEQEGLWDCEMLDKR